MDCDTCLKVKAFDTSILASGLKCYGIAPRNISAADLIAYAARSGATLPDQLCMVQTQLLAGRLLYWKQKPGDCPTATKINLGPISGISKGLGIAGTGIAAASGIGLAATGGAGIGASAAGSGAALGGLPSIFSAIAGPAALIAIPIAVWSIISAHHKIAVAKEQATICDVTQAYNQWEDTVESAIALGQMQPSDVKTAILTLEPQLMQALQAIVKGGCNAACYYQRALKALDLYAVEKLYDSLSPRAAATMGNPANPAKPSTAAGAKFSTYGIAGVGAYGTVKLAGALI